MARYPWRTRSATHRRSGPERKKARRRPVGAVQRKQLQLRRSRAGWGGAQWLTVSLAAAGAAAVTFRERLGLGPAVALPIASFVPLSVAAVGPPNRWRHIAAGAAYMWAFKVTWEIPYDDPSKLERRLQVRYPVTIDTALGLGAPPTLRLQRALRRRGTVSALDRVVVAIYASWLLPHAVMMWIWARHPKFVPRAGGRLAAAYHLTTPFYYLLPTAPPWWASRHRGEMGGAVDHVLSEVIDDLRGRPDGDGDEGDSSGNPWASMPSDHIASAAITAMALSEVGPPYAAFGWTYVLLAAFSVVYLGEHYAVDVLAGLLVAEAIRRGEPLAVPAIRRIAQDLERLNLRAR